MKFLKQNREPCGIFHETHVAALSMAALALKTSVRS